MSTDSPFSPAGQAPQPQPPTKDNTGTIILIILAVTFFLFLVCAGLLALLLMPAITAARSAATQAQKNNELKMVALAMHNYHDVHRQLPAAYSTDSDGNQLGSWRVALTPFLESQHIWDQWDSTQAWDSPANQPLLEQTPTEYRAVGDEPAGAHSGETHLFAIRHPQTVFGSSEPVRFRDILDGTSNTIALVYLPNVSVPWTSPQDISLEEAYVHISQTTPQAPVYFVMSDGSVRRVTSPPSQETFEALVTYNGREMIDDDAF